MKFESKDGKVFGSIEAATNEFCNSRNCECNGCLIANKHCLSWVIKHPKEAAALMGYKVIEDYSELAVKIPRDIGKMTLAEAKEYCRKQRIERTPKYKFCNESECGCELKRRNICIDWVHEWNFDRLTPEELEICRALEAKWVSRDGSCEGEVVHLWSSEPKQDEDGDYLYSSDNAPIAAVFKGIFKSINRGDCINVEELLNGT